MFRARRRAVATGERKFGSNSVAVMLAGVGVGDGYASGWLMAIFTVPRVDLKPRKDVEAVGVGSVGRPGLAVRHHVRPGGCWRSEAKSKCPGEGRLARCF